MEKEASDVNAAAVEIVKAYLEYSGMLLKTVMESKSYSSPLKEINDQLVIQPDELVDLLNKVQKALVSAKD
jgi:hypothetical protein